MAFGFSTKFLPSDPDEEKKYLNQLLIQIKNTSENLTKIITETSFKNNQVLEKLNNELLEIMNDRGIEASYLQSPLSKITNHENKSQFEAEEDPNSNRVKDL